MPQASYVTSRVALGGRIILPAPYRKALGIRPGDRVVLRLEKSQVRVYAQAEALRRIQEGVSKHVPRRVSLVEELIRERRREAARE